MFSEFSPLIQASEPPRYASLATRDAPGVGRRTRGFDARVQRDVRFGKDPFTAAAGAEAAEVVEESVRESKLLILGGWFSCMYDTV